MRIAVLSDNHASIDPELPGALAGCDEFWHAGDFVDDELLGWLRARGPVVAVRGNNDLEGDAGRLPVEARIIRNGWPVLLRHICGHPERPERVLRESLALQPARIVVAGHSHRPWAEERDGLVWLNPGSCGPRRFQLPRCFGMLELEPHEARFVVHELGTGRTLIDRRFGR